MDSAADADRAAQRANAWRARAKTLPTEIIFHQPRRTIAVSLTGAYCALNCAHCGGHYLRAMTPISRVLPNGATSFLISGGCDHLGRVPVANHLDDVARLRPGHRLNWHVGLIGEEEAQAIAPLVDIVSFDLIGDEETIQEVYGLDCGVEAYLHTYKMLCRYVRVVPHIIIGLRGGQLGHELPALLTLEKLGAEAIVFLVFIPTPGTRYANRQPPAIEDVVKLLLTAREMFPETPIYLGCMRPGGRYRSALDPLAVRAGVNRIVNPAPAAQREAERLGLRVRWAEECCVL